MTVTSDLLKLTHWINLTWINVYTILSPFVLKPKDTKKRTKRQLILNHRLIKLIKQLINLINRLAFIKN